MSKRSGLAVVLCMLLGLPVGWASSQVEYEFEGGQWIPTTAPAEGTPEGELAIIRRCVDRGANRSAVNRARNFPKKYPDSPARQEVMMLAGVAEMNRGMYFQAYEWFEKQLAESPDGRYSARSLDCEYAIAEAFLGGKKRVVAKVFRLSAKDEGVDILNRIPEHVPGSALAEKSLMRIGDFRYSAGDYTDAALAYDHYLQLFGKSSQAPTAMLKAANATYTSYGGVQYDDTPLIEAQQRFRRFSESYPLSAKTANVPTVLTQIQDAQAAKAFETARFYQRLRQPRAAAFYYRLVTDQYPDTDWASQAKVQLAKLDGAKQVARVDKAPSPTASTRPVVETRRDVVDLETLAPATQKIGTKK